MKYMYETTVMYLGVEWDMQMFDIEYDSETKTTRQTYYLIRGSGMDDYETKRPDMTLYKEGVNISFDSNRICARDVPEDQISFSKAGQAKENKKQSKKALGL